MPIFMDRHYDESATRHAIEWAHTKDLEVQDKYRCKFLMFTSVIYILFLYYFLTLLRICA